MQRLAAAWGVALILVLSLLAVRPDWHDVLCHHEAQDTATSMAQHHHATSSADHSTGIDGSAGGCVVSLFAHGHILAALFVSLGALFVDLPSEKMFPAKQLALVSVDHTLPHSCGPPAA